MTNPDQPDDCVLGRGFTNPIYILPTPRDMNMTTETQTPEFTEEQLQSTNTAKGFQAYSYISDLMQRYPMDLDAVRAGRIFSDNTVNAKLRRKLVKGQPDQNTIFEAYRTQDNNNVPYATVEISKEAFTPSMLLAAVASKLMLDRQDAYTHLAYHFVQFASALLQEGDKAHSAEVETLNPEADPQKTEYYAHLNGLQARAYCTTVVSDILNIVLGDQPNSRVSLATDLDYAREKANDEIHGEGARAEIMATTNVLTAAIANLAFSKTFNDVVIMADEIKANVGEAAMVELSGEAQE